MPYEGLRGTLTLQADASRIQDSHLLPFHAVKGLIMVGTFFKSNEVLRVKPVCFKGLRVACYSTSIAE